MNPFGAGTKFVQISLVFICLYVSIRSWSVLLIILGQITRSMIHLRILSQLLVFVWLQIFYLAICVRIKQFLQPKLGLNHFGDWSWRVTCRWWVMFVTASLRDMIGVDLVEYINWLLVHTFVPRDHMATEQSEDGRIANYNFVWTCP